MPLLPAAEVPGQWVSVAGVEGGTDVVGRGAVMGCGCGGRVAIT